LPFPFYKKNRKKKPRNPWYHRILEFFGAIGLLLLVWAALFGSLDRIVMPIFTAHGQELPIPNLVDLEYETARQKALNSGFKIHSTIEQKFDPLFPEGVVLEQYPPAATLSKLGRKIKLTVSAGEKLFPVPELIGISEKEAVMRIRAEGFFTDPDSDNFVFSDYYPEGVIAEQSMPPASMMRKNSFIRLTVSMGAKPQKFMVPEVRTLSFFKARKELLKAGLSLGFVEYIYFPQADSGQVVEQIPAPGSKALESTPVNLQIAGAPNPITSTLLAEEDSVR